MNIAIFCSSNDLDAKYTSPAEDLATSLAKDGHAMIYGGSEYGLMKRMADSMQRAGGRVVGITCPPYSQYARKNADEMIVVKTLGERKSMILDRSEAIIMTVGGLGTLDEATEVLELKKQARHNKTFIILNTEGFYDGLKAQLERMDREGFLKMGEQVGVSEKRLEQFVTFADSVDEVIAITREPKKSRAL